jgi:chromosome condensin MukBEF MukE localization factor
MITTKLSQKIYSQLINGKAINKYAYILKTNELEDNGLYNEIFNNFDEYNTLYQRINFELVHKNSCFFYIREFGGEDVNEVTIKIQALLIIIGRIITEQGYLFDVLTDHRAGVKAEDLAIATSEERYLDILHTCKLCLKRGIEEEINNNLVARGLMYINSRGRYVLTEAGRSFFDELTATD